MDDETTNSTGVKTRYGIIILVIQDEKVLMSRRVDTPKYSKKWQLLNGRMHGHETSYDACVRILERETDIKLFTDAFTFLDSLTLEQIDEFYYVYAVNIPKTTVISDDAKKETKQRSDWRFFELQRAIVLDSAPGIRSILLKLTSGLNKVKRGIVTDKSKTQRLPPIIPIPMQTQQHDFAAQGCCDV